MTSCKGHMTSDTILNLLLTKHSKDLCIPECKTGSTMHHKNVRHMDLWVMAKSWARPYTIAYEIKCNRQDFLRDEKWQEYLQYCNYLYFVCPIGAIDPSEVSEEAGLLIGSKNLRRLHIKKKAPYREVTIPESLWRYILMWRAQIIRENIYSQENKEFWAGWLEGKKNNQSLGYRVSKKLRQDIETLIHEKQIENNELRSRIEKLEAIKQFLEDRKINPSAPRYTLEKRLEELLSEERTGIPNGALTVIDQSLLNLQTLKRVLTDQARV